jgi:hypothetical protein
MLDGTDPRLLLEWQEFYNLEPFGEVRDDIRAATICLSVTQAMGAKKQGGGKFSLKDFMPDFARPAAKPELSPLAAQSILKDRYSKK